MKTYTLPVKFLEGIDNNDLSPRQRRELVTNRVKLEHSTLKGIPGATSSNVFVHSYAATINHPDFMVVGIALDEYDKDLQLEITPMSVECDEYIAEHGIDNIILGMIYVDGHTVGGCYFKTKANVAWDDYVYDYRLRSKNSQRNEAREVLDLNLIIHENLCATDGVYFIDSRQYAYRVCNGNHLTPLDDFPIRLLQNELHWSYLTKEQSQDYKFHNVEE